MEWIDVSLPIDSKYPTWPEQPGMQLRSLSRVENGAIASNSEICMYLHFGTHIDAPLHSIGGGRSVDNLELAGLIGPCRVIDCTGIPIITRKTLARQPLDGASRLLCKTDNSRRIHDNVFHRDYVGLDVSAAEYLIERGILTVGVDYYSAAAFKNAVKVHRCFLGADGVFIEGVDLGKVEPGEYQLVALPIRVVGAEAAPARVLLGR